MRDAQRLDLARRSLLKLVGPGIPTRELSRRTRVPRAVLAGRRRSLSRDEVLTILLVTVERGHPWTSASLNKWLIRRGFSRLSASEESVFRAHMERTTRLLPRPFVNANAAAQRVFFLCLGFFTHVAFLWVEMHAQSPDPLAPRLRLVVTWAVVLTLIVGATAWAVNRWRTRRPPLAPAA